MAKPTRIEAICLLFDICRNHPNPRRDWLPAGLASWPGYPPMGPYILTVFHEGENAPRERATASRASEVLDQIRSLLGRHPDCHRIRVETTAGFLFAVDCNGATVFEPL